MKPNIFDIATKELHQDAFIAWLLQWADTDNKQFDELLHFCGQEFIRNLITSQHQETISTILKVKAGRQWENIDVWAEVYTPENNYLIIIEDKTFTTEHSNQLTTYKKTGEDYCVEKNFKLVCVYIKTGSEPEGILNSIRSNGFSTFNRQDFIKLLNKYENISNNIFIDFTHRLLNLDATYNAFETTKINNWNDPCWIGFYQLLEKEIGLLNWSKVNNPAGGFWNAGLTKWEYYENYAVFLQIEQGKLCFKICTDPEEVDFDENKTDRADLRNERHEFILNKARELNISEIRRPDRFGNGKYMTVAVIDRDIWIGDGNSIIDKSAVITRLKKYKKFFTECLN
ncbi:MAG: PD-(D/E)XK nuclease family protein [Bacteroidota bacterium]|nr:PD-(D/E)XK nuclease family protein [Bacteroidota bacterium]